jgi:hypothetical protein
MPVTLRSQFTDLFASLLPYLKELFYEEHREPDDKIGMVFNSETSTRMQEQTTGVSGMPLAVLTNEGQTVTYDQLLQAFDKTYTHSKYTLGTRISEETDEDDQHGVFRNVVKALARSMRTTRNMLVWNVFNNGFTTELTPDAVSLFNTGHVLLEGANQSNTAAADLDLTSIENAVNAMRDTRDHRGLLIEMEPRFLVHPSELEWLAKELLRSNFNPTTANMGVNPIEGILTPIMVKYLTNATDSFITTGPGEHALMYFDRKTATFEDETEFDTGTIKIKSVQRHSQGASDWRGTYGLNGT